MGDLLGKCSGMVGLDDYFSAWYSPPQKALVQAMGLWLFSQDGLFHDVSFSDIPPEA